MDKRTKFMRKRENELGLVFRLTNITFRSQFVNHIKFYCFVESLGLFNTFKRASIESFAFQRERLIVKVEKKCIKERDSTTRER